MNGGDWWRATNREQSANAWIDVLSSLPFCARVETRGGAVGLVHAAPVHGRWYDLEECVHGDEDLSHLTRTRALWSRVRHGFVQREIGETGHEHLGPVEGVRAVVTGHTPVPEPRLARERPRNRHRRAHRRARLRAAHDCADRRKGDRDLELRAVKVQILSDLHLEHGGQVPEHHRDARVTGER